MKDWRSIAKASGFAIPAADLERVAPVLEALEESFRPLSAGLRPDDEPSVEFHPEEDVE